MKEYLSEVQSLESTESKLNYRTELILDIKQLKRDTIGGRKWKINYKT